MTRASDPRTEKEDLLSAVDVDKISSVARARGFLHWELYAEASDHCAIDIHAVKIQGRLEDVRLWTTGGLALRAFDGRMARHFTTTGLSTESLLCAMGENARSRGAASPARPLPPSETPRKFKLLSHAARTVLAMEDAGARFPSFAYADTLKRFAIVTSAGIATGGREETVEAASRWSLEKKGKLHHFSTERFGASVAALMGELETHNPFHRGIVNSIGLSNPWPCPNGEIPILWSQRALSKLLLHFLRGFEGDLVLGHLSFLTELNAALPSTFSVYEAPDTGRLPCDNEGSPRRRVTVFEGGKPKALAVNNAVAEQLAVPSTGHCRRESLRDAPTVGFWNPLVQGTRITPSIMQRMEWGISVRDIDVVRFFPATGDIEIRLTEATLVHHGEEGEWVEPLDLRLNLLSLLDSLHAFDDKPGVTGLQSTKGSQRFITEITTPAAISQPIGLPGQVPANHYW